jgi:thimet oligopeptidase
MTLFARLAPVVAFAVVAGCASARPRTLASASSPAAATSSPVAATSSPVAAASSPVAGASPRRLAPFSGELAASDPKTLQAACDRAVLDARAQIVALKASPRGQTNRVLQAYDAAGASLGRAGGIAGVVFNANPDPAMRAVAETCERAINIVQSEITLDRSVYDALAALDLNAADAATRFWIEQDLADFRRAGVNRDDATRAQIKTLRDQVLALGQRFDQNINDATRKVALLPSELAGLPADWIANHRPGADGKVIVTTQYPDYLPFITFAKSPSAREKLFRAFRTRAYPQNLEVLGQLLAKRHELATLLGYPNWAAYSMESQMIRTPTAAHEFIDQIVRASEKRAIAEYKLLLARLRKDQPGAKMVQPWDKEFLADRVRAEQLDFDAQSVRPYFEFNRVKAGLLDLTARMFGIEYRRVTDARVWHPDVDVYDVVDGQQRLGRIYLDLHPRAGKYSHAAQFSFVTGQKDVRLPEGVLLCNFPKPGDAPALMDHGEVKTFFHEFGHLLHHIFAGHTRWTGTAGLREGDFVEAPSQLLEEWVDDAATLQTFALHDQTQQPIPTELVQRMRTAEEFGRGLSVRRQMTLAEVSLGYYDRDPSALDTSRMFADVERRLLPFAHAEGTFEQAAFDHLNGYSSNYYTYMWSLVIAKDLFTPFKAAGLLDRGVAMRYRHEVLEAGGSKPAAEMVRAFLGRPFSFKAYQDWLDAAPKPRG